MPPRKRAKKEAVARAVAGPTAGLPWWARYAPREEADLVVFPKTTKRIREWLERAISDDAANHPGSSPMVLVAAGRPGIGKSAAVETVAAALGVHVVRWRDAHASAFVASSRDDDDDAYEVARRRTDAPEARLPAYESRTAQWQEFVRSAAYPSLPTRASRTPRDNTKALLVIDELPTSTDDHGWSSTSESARAATAAVRATLRHVSREAARPVAIILSDGIREKSEARLVVERALGADALAAVEYVEFNAITELKMRERLAAIARAERSRVAPATIERIAAEADGDLRAAISRLEVASTTETTTLPRRPPQWANADWRTPFSAVTAPSKQDVVSHHHRKADADDGDSDDDLDDTRRAGDAASALHAIGRLLRARRRDDGERLAFSPDRVARTCPMAADAVAAFVQFNCVEYFGDADGELALALDDLSAADLFVARIYSTDFSRDAGGDDATYPRCYVAALAARTVAARNAHPAPSAFRPIRRPRLYDLLPSARAAAKAKLVAEEDDNDDPVALRGDVLLDVPRVLLLQREGLSRSAGAPLLLGGGASFAGSPQVEEDPDDARNRAILAEDDILDDDDD
mmetsp:Transcript_9995/g.40525  ORF Transcript_9995/g.40525 Transcript_9995/m.40525 type:complete len:579 (-) Transcript_9995:96-1832(-)